MATRDYESYQEKELPIACRKTYITSATRFYQLNHRQLKVLKIDKTPLYDFFYP